MKGLRSSRLGRLREARSLAGSRGRRPPAGRTALTVALAAGLLAVTAPFAAAAASGGAGAPTVTPGSKYLALGDSVTFGFQESTVVPPPNYQDAASFLGYPEQLGAELRLNVVNAACPGETSSSLIDASAQSNGCENSARSSTGYRKLYPLHVHYKGSQLTFAVHYLLLHRNVKLVSLMIGANDLFLCQTLTADGCTSSSEQHATLSKTARNVRRILAAIRHVAHYRGQLAIVNYYSLNYASSFLSGVSLRLDQAADTAARPFHVVVADGYGELAAAARHFGGDTCAAGLLTAWGNPRKCGVHPSYAGQALLAQALEKAIAL